MNILKPITSLFSQKQAAPIVEARAASPMSAVIQPKAQDRLYELIEREQLPGDVRETLAGALTGDLPRQQLLFQAMIDTWPRLQKNLTEVARSVSSTPWEIQPYSEQGDDATDSAIEKARMVQTAIEGMAPRPAWDELSERGLVKSLVHGYYMGHQVCEVFWDRKPEGTMPRSAKIVPPRFYDYPDTGEDRLMFSPDGGFYSGNYEDFPEHHFVIAVNRGHGAHPSIAAPLRALTGYWLAATFGLKWLLQFAQLYGVPFRWAEYEDETVKSKVCNMLENIGSAGWGAFPKGTKLDFVNAGQSADSLPQAMLLEMADKQCDTFILGQTLTTDVGNSGSRALGDVHQEVRAGVIQGVNDFVGDIFNHQLIPSIIKLNYGNADELPKYNATVEAPKDEIGMAQRDQTLISMGMEVGKEWLYERHGVPMPEEGDDDVFSPGGNGAGGDPQTGNSVLSPNETPSEADPDNNDEEVEASMVRAYDPNQKRAEKGSDNGGQWVKDDGTSVKGDEPKKSRVSEAESKRYSELEAKFNKGTITDEELGEAHDLVEKAAKAAGYDTEKVYHGTDTEFEVFDDKELGTATDSESAEKAFFFSDDEKTAKAYANWAAEEGPVKEALAEADRAEKIGDWDAYDKAVIKSEELAASAYKRRMAKARVIPAYLKGNFLEVDAEGATPQELKGSGGDIDFGISSKLDEAKEGGYDGVIFRNLDDAIGLYDRPSDHYAVFNPNQIKSADIFTGTPLAERFDDKDDRITFSHAVQAYDPNQKRGAKGSPDGGRWVKEDGASSSDEASDADYLAAVEAGDTEAAQAMVEKEEAKAIGKYKGQGKTRGFIKDITYLKVSTLSKMETTSEVSKLPQDVAEKVKFEHPIEVSVFANGKVQITDGHHRFAAAKQTGVVFVPVAVTSINAKEDRIIELIKENSKASGLHQGEVIPLSRRFNFGDRKYTRTERGNSLTTYEVPLTKELPEKKLESSNAVQAAEAKKATIDQLSDNVLESLTGVTREWLSPVRPHFEKLAAMAMSKNVSDADFIEALEKSQREMPELFDKLNVEALQTSMEDAIGTAMIVGSVERYGADEVKAGGWITTEEGNKVFLDNPRKKSLDKGLTDPRKKGDNKPSKPKAEKAAKGSLGELKESIRAGKGKVDEKLKDLEAKRAEIQKQINELGVSLPKAPPRGEYEDLQSYAEARVEYVQSFNKAARKRNKKIDEVNQVIWEMETAGVDLVSLPADQRGITPLINKGKPGTFNRRRGLELYEQVVHKDLVEKFPLKFGGVSSRGRATWYGNPPGAKPPYMGVAGYNEIGIGKNNSPSLVVHEIVHGLEADKEILKSSASFLKKRVGDEGLKKLKDYSKGYRNNEVYFEDKFKSKGGSTYDGKVYGLNGDHGRKGAKLKTSEIRATEILTQGVQRLLKNPAEFLENDEEYFDFVVNTLQKKK